MMGIYTVLEPPLYGQDAGRHAERFVFVREGFSFAAFIFAPLWMLRHRMWLAFLAYVFVASVLVLVLRSAEASFFARSVVFLLLHLLVGFEASSLRRAALLSRDWRDHGVVAADDLEGAERRFFASWVAQPTTRGRPDAGGARMRHNEDVIGLFPKPGAHR